MTVIHFFVLKDIFNSNMPIFLLLLGEIQCFTLALMMWA